MTKIHAQIVVTGKQGQWSNCKDCPCQKIRSDESVVNAVDSDAQTKALVGWLSSGSPLSSVDEAAPSPSRRNCVNRLRASIVILNAIRDTCRPYLGQSPATSSMTHSSLSEAPKAKRSPVEINQHATYEESFPSLKDATSTTSPTILIGKKKNKGQKKNIHLSTKKEHMPKTNLNFTTKHQFGERKRSQYNGNSKLSTFTSGHENSKAPGVKRRIRPTVISLPSESLSGKSTLPHSSTKIVTAPITHQNAQFPKLEGNISSLSSEDTSQISATSRPRAGSNSNGNNDTRRNSTKYFIEKKSHFPIENSSRQSKLQHSGQKSTDIDLNASDPVEIGAKVGALCENQDHQTSSTFGQTTADSRTSNSHESNSVGLKLKRLIDIYSTILKNNLAPFILLEFHLLVRLISLSDKSEKIPQEGSIPDTPNPFSTIFTSEKSCRDFAANSLTNLKHVIVNLGHETIKMFASFPEIQRRCHSLYLELQDAIERGNSELIFETDQKALGATGNTPHLTLPFDRARDSRHNYRTFDLNRLYKEREELRDAFLYQLRAFQDMRGRLMNNEQADKVIRSIKYESREILKNLSSGNILWFVNFFCDLLLQVGLVPVGETDSEVLRHVTDQKRLQKLHMRFTSKSGQTNRSSHKLSIDQRGSSSNDSIAPEHKFQGHQEFFLLFLKASDSFKFNVHLKLRLAQLISDFTCFNDTKGLCQQIAKLQLLAKFLGLLVFGPNWDLPNGDSVTMPSLSGPSVGHAQFDATLSPMNLKKYIECAWKECRLIVVLPWVVQFLSMMKWDMISRKSQYYEDIFALLWGIKNYCPPAQMNFHSHSQTNMFLVSLHLETFFRDVVGFVETQNLPIINLDDRQSTGAGLEAPNDRKSFDREGVIHMDLLPLWFSKPFLLSSLPYLEDLYDLLNDFTHNFGKTGGSGFSKKLRPDSISIGLPPKNLSSINSWNKSIYQPFLADERNLWSTHRLGIIQEKEQIKDRLIDSFFHQHKDLQQLSEMTIDRVIKNFSETVSRSCITPIFKKGASSYEEYFLGETPMSHDEYLKLIQTLEADASAATRSLMNRDFERIIRETLRLLAPPMTNAKVLEIASTLAINHAIQKGEYMLRHLIFEESKKMIDEFSRKEKKAKAGVPLSSSKLSRDQPRNSNKTKTADSLSISTLTASLVAFRGIDQCGEQSLESFKQAKLNVVNTLRRVDEAHGFRFTAEDLASAMEFESQIIAVFECFFSAKSSKALTLFEVGVESIEVLCLLSKLGFFGTAREKLESLLCNHGNITALMNQVKEVDCADSSQLPSDPSSKYLSPEYVGNFLFNLLEGSLVDYRALERALIYSVGNVDQATNVSHLLLSKFSSEAGINDQLERSTVMVRLRNLLQN